MDLYELVKKNIITLSEYHFFSASIRIDTVEAFICRLPQINGGLLSRPPEWVLEEAKKLVPEFNPDQEMPEKGKGALKPPVKVRSKEAFLQDYSLYKNWHLLVLEVLIDIRDALMRDRD